MNASNALRRPPRRGTGPLVAGRGGFTLVELLVAVVVLTFGLLAFAGTTVVLIRQVTLAGLATERATAVQSVVERLRALPYDSVGSGSDSLGAFRVSWTSTTLGATKEVRVVTLGPGARGQTLSPGVADTFSTRILEP